MRRSGTHPEDENLTIAYSSLALMRAWYVGWVGARRNNQTFIDFANTQGDLSLSSPSQQDPTFCLSLMFQITIKWISGHLPATLSTGPRMLL